MMFGTKNKSELAYSLIEQMITFRDIAPGAMISESYLMEATSLGRSPVRDAIQRLSAEKMVEVHPRKGIFVPTMSVEVQLKLLEVRRTLEEQAVRLASHRSSLAHKEAMLSLAEQLEDDSNYQEAMHFGDLLKRVHLIIANATQNEYLKMSILPLLGLSRRFWFAYVQMPEVEFARAAHLHSSTLKAICHGDEEQAALASRSLNDYLTEFAYHSIKLTPNHY